MKACLTAVVATVLVGSHAASAQEPEFAAGSLVAERIRSGGWFEPSKRRRGTDGALEMNCFADVGGSTSDEQGRFVPLLGPDLERGLRSGGAIGFVTILCHGPGDLLGMTEAEFHLGALGIDATDFGLRQFLAKPRPSFDGPRGLAELLGCLLAIDVGCAGASRVRSPSSPHGRTSRHCLPHCAKVRDVGSRCCAAMRTGRIRSSGSTSRSRARR